MTLLRDAFAAAGLADVRPLAVRPLTECFLGTHTDTGADVFIKALHSDAPGVLKNFLREIDTLQALRDAAFSPVLQAHSSEPGIVFHACEYLSEPRFDQLACNDDMSLDGVLRLACALAEWLQRLHARGYVHRDLSPDHIFSGEQITVVDFGLAKRMDEMTTADRQQSIGYDVAAFGLVVWELICGRRIFTYRSPALALEIPPQLDVIHSLDLPHPLARTLTGCLAARSEMSPEGGTGEGFTSAGEVVAALHAEPM